MPERPRLKSPLVGSRRTGRVRTARPRAHPRRPACGLARRSRAPAAAGSSACCPAPRSRKGAAAPGRPGRMGQYRARRFACIAMALVLLQQRVAQVRARQVGAQHQVGHAESGAIVATLRGVQAEAVPGVAEYCHRRGSFAPALRRARVAAGADANARFRSRRARVFLAGTTRPPACRGRHGLASGRGPARQCCLPHAASHGNPKCRAGCAGAPAIAQVWAAVR